MNSADFGLLSPVWAGRPVAEATGDEAFLRALVEVEAALARVQGEPVTASEINAELDLEPALSAEALAARGREGGNPVIPLVAALDDTRLHRGATSQDIFDTAMMLIARRALELTGVDLERAIAAATRLAAEHRDTPMAARTLTQQAVPTTFGLKAAGWRHLLIGARDKVLATRSALPVQLGGAAGTLAAFPARSAGPASGGTAGTLAALAAASAGAEGGAADESGLARGVEAALELVAALAAELGLAEPLLPWHVLRLPIADLAGVLALASGALGKIAADVLVLARTEIAEVAEGVGGTSSSMPHKSNPVRAVLVYSASCQVPALASILFASMVAEDERPAGAWHAEWQPLREALRLVGGAAAALAELLEGLRVDPERMAANFEIPREPLGAAAALVDRALKEEA